MLGKYYYSDALLELELNLHKIRQDLVSMLELLDCDNCYTLKCTCIQDKKNGSEKSSSNEFHVYENKEKKEQADGSLKLRNKESPAPSTPEKVTVNEDIEKWMAASRRAEVNLTTVANTKKPLVTIESIRPADVSRKDLQKSNIFSNKNFTKDANAVMTFYKHFKETADNSKYTYFTLSQKLGNSRIKENYNHF